MGRENSLPKSAGLQTCGTRPTNHERLTTSTRRGHQRDRLSATAPIKYRRVARAVEWDGFENRYTLTGVGGSNPSLSAIFWWCCFKGRQQRLITGSQDCDAKPTSHQCLTGSLQEVANPVAPIKFRRGASAVELGECKNPVVSLQATGLLIPHSPPAFRSAALWRKYLSDQKKSHRHNFQKFTLYAHFP